jgi:hypothetical protein
MRISKKERAEFEHWRAHASKQEIRRLAEEQRLNHARGLLTSCGFVQRLDGSFAIPRKSKARRRAEGMEP